MVDRELCEKMYKACYMNVYSYLLSLSKDRELAEELTEETFYRAFTTKATFREESEESTWLCSIGKNLFLDEMRRRGKIEEMPEEVESKENIENAAEDKDLSFRIHLEIHNLQEPYKEVFELRVFGDLSFYQIGTIFGKTESWARVTYHRAKLQIQERMGGKI